MSVTPAPASPQPPASGRGGEPLVDATLNRRLPQVDPTLRQRIARLAELGLGAPDPRLDAFAVSVAEEAGEPFAMVNLVTDRQNFVGLAGPIRRPDLPDLPAIGRAMTLREGYCPVVARTGKTRVLADVFTAPRFAGNPVVNGLGIRTYAGAPIIDEDTGLVLGTVCFVGTTPRDLDSEDWMFEFIKRKAEEVVPLLVKDPQ